MVSKYTYKSKKWWQYLNIFGIEFGLKFWSFFSVIVLILSLLVFANFSLKVNKVNIDFLDSHATDQQTINENREIKNYLEQQIRKEANSFIKYLFLNKSLITKLVRDEYQIVDEIHFAKKINLDLNVKVSKNDEFFYTCVDEDQGFLVRCMMGNSNGSFFKEVNDDFESDEVLKFKINNKVLHNKYTQDKSEELDSLSGTRIYTESDFSVLKEMLKWLQKNGFQIEELYIDELKIVNIKTDFYVLKVSLDKGYLDTIKDFETISRTGKLQEAINEDKESIEYIDLSFKNKVFFKLKNQLENDIKNDTMSTTSIIQ